jgi:hypothetical protein
MQTWNGGDRWPRAIAALMRKECDRHLKRKSFHDVPSLGQLVQPDRIDEQERGPEFSILLPPSSDAFSVRWMFSQCDPESPYLNQLSAIHLKLIDRGDSDFR